MTKKPIPLDDGKYVPLRSKFVYSRKMDRPMCRDHPSLILTGLHNTLKQAFYSNRKFSEVKRIVRERDKKKGYKPKIKRLSPTKGRALGKRIDRELGYEINRRSRLIDKKAKRKKKTSKPRKLHVYTQAILKWCRKKHYRPVQTQPACGSTDPAYKVWTAADFMVLDETSGTGPAQMDLIGGEIKVFADDYYDVPVPGKFLQAPYTDIPDTQRNRDQLQLAFTKHFMDLTFPARKAQGWFLLRAHQTDGSATKIGVHKYTIEEWVQSDPQIWRQALRAIHPDVLRVKRIAKCCE